MEDYMSNWSSARPGSTPHTPLEQVPPTFLARGVGSSTSLCTTDDEEAESQYGWTPEQEQLVASVLQEYRDNPRNTPFSGRFPPSGVVQRVARAVVKRASQAGRSDFPHSVVAIRKKILSICARDDPDMTPPMASAAFSAQINQLPQQPHNSYQTGALGSAMDGPLRINTQNRAGFGAPLGAPLDAPLSSPRDYEQFDFSEGRGSSNNNNNSNVPLSSPFKEEFRARPGTAVYQQQPQQPQQPPHPSTDSNVLNIVAQRKRDSLKMKRGLK